MTKFWISDHPHAFPKHQGIWIVEGDDNSTSNGSSMPFKSINTLQDLLIPGLYLVIGG